MSRRGWDSAKPLAGPSGMSGGSSLAMGLDNRDGIRVRRINRKTSTTVHSRCAARFAARRASYRSRASRADRSCAEFSVARSARAFIERLERACVRWYGRLSTEATFLSLADERRFLQQAGWMIAVC